MEPRFVPGTLADWFSENAPAELRPHLAAACCTRGKRKGRVLASVPTSKGPEAVGAWRSVMSTLAPSRAGLFGLLWSDPKERETFDACEQWLAEHPEAADVIRLAGGAPLEFSLFHWNLDADRIRRFADAVSIDADACGASWYGKGDER